MLLPKYLTDKQKEAVNFKDGNLQIIACAGSGKTDVIAWRIVRLIENSVAPEKILAFTFTDKAAEEMKFRVRKYMEENLEQPGDSGRMFIGTIHSFCLEFLRFFVPEYQGYDVLDENARIVFVHANYSDIGLDTTHFGKWFRWENRYWNRWEKIKNFLTNVDILREEMVKPNKVTDHLFREAYQRYDELLHRRRYLDYSSMMRIVADLLSKDEGLRKEAQKRWQYLLVDEYQDINTIQEKIIQLLAGKNGNLCVVGDDDQSIYNWRGTKVKNMLTFNRRYHEITKIPVAKNFRSSLGIVNHAKSVIIHSKGHRLPKSIENGNSQQYEDGDIYNLTFYSEHDEVEFVINKINELRGIVFKEPGKAERPIDWRDIALLFRSVKHDARPFIDGLHEADIPLFVKGSTGLFDHPEVTIVLDAMKYITSITNTFKADKNAKLEYHLLFQKGSSRRKYDVFRRKLEKARSKYQNKTWLNLQRIFQDALNSMGLSKYEFKEEIICDLGRLSQVISDYEGIHYPVKRDSSQLYNFFDFIERYAAEAYEEGGPEERFAGPNAVQIMTIHKSKGLQFPCIFMPALTGRNFPRSRKYSTMKWFLDDNLIRKSEYQNDEPSQRRLFYVALTRSKKFLFLTSCQTRSHFLNEISSENIISNDCKDPTIRKKSNKYTDIVDIKFPTNFSELSDFFECPYSYKMRYLYGFNPVIRPLIGYGRSVHHLLNVLHKNAQAGQRLTKEEIDTLTTRLFFLRFASDDAFERGRTSARKVLQSYADSYKHDLELSLETERPFEFILEDTLISGQIDLVKRQTPEGEKLDIIDFKTEKVLDVNEEIAKLIKARNAEQVILYGIGHEKSYGVEPEKTYVHYLDEVSGGKRKLVKYGGKEKTRVMDKVKRAVCSIKQANFERHPGHKSLCASCDFKDMCKGPVIISKI